MYKCSELATLLPVQEVYQWGEFPFPRNARLNTLRFTQIGRPVMVLASYPPRRDWAELQKEGLSHTPLIPDKWYKFNGRLR